MRVDLEEPAPAARAVWAASPADKERAAALQKELQDLSAMRKQVRALGLPDLGASLEEAIEVRRKALLALKPISESIKTLQARTQQLTVKVDKFNLGIAKLSSERGVVLSKRSSLAAELAQLKQEARLASPSAKAAASRRSQAETSDADSENSHAAMTCRQDPYNAVHSPFVFGEIPQMPLGPAQHAPPRRPRRALSGPVRSSARSRRPPSSTRIALQAVRRPATAGVALRRRGGARTGPRQAWRPPRQPRQASGPSAGSATSPSRRPASASTAATLPSRRRLSSTASDQ